MQDTDKQSPVGTSVFQQEAVLHHYNKVCFSHQNKTNHLFLWKARSNYIYVYFNVKYGSRLYKNTNISLKNSNHYYFFTHDYLDKSNTYLLYM